MSYVTNPFFRLSLSFFLVEVLIVDAKFSCKKEYIDDSRVLTCANVTSELDLGQAIKDNMEFDAEEFVLLSSDLRFISHDSFLGTKIKKISIRDTDLMSLSDTSTAFEGLEDTLEEIMARRCNFVSEWKFSHLGKLKRIKKLAIWESDLDYVSRFPNSSSGTLKDLELRNNRIAAISSEAFSALNNVEKLTLVGNEIVKVERSSFPKPATYLEELDLSYNKIRSLPQDIFTEMPALTYLFITHNQIRTIDEAVFKPVWKQLLVLFFQENGLICDCRLKWILKNEDRNKLVVRCDDPPNLKGKLVPYLKNNDLWC